MRYVQNGWNLSAFQISVFFLYRLKNLENFESFKTVRIDPRKEEEEGEEEGEEDDEEDGSITIKEVQEIPHE